ncbi:unnamed protein product [Didymodactylos carnosus]|uniref:Ig-like domain-containing protein n=1 Tax=Didymodactylos carnosus TaxID=1234261 RepID=A0A8S2EJC4_9BILA|nr:unnamed protein product [Didymodactylos carnosus]CAF3975063.1 unnamed protein product [Didymodactylos carnosus]
MHSFDNSRYFPNGWLPPPRSSQHSRSDQLYKPVSKSFNRISDFIFPDTVHICLRDSNPLKNKSSRRPLASTTNAHRYNRIENYSLPVLNHQNKRDLIIVERLPIDQLKDINLLYKEQKQRCYDTRRSLTTQSSSDGRRYSSIIVPSELNKTTLNDYFSSNHDRSQVLVNNRTSRSATYRERLRDRRKRHTTDDAYHTIMRSMIDNDVRVPNCVLSYTTALEPITDSESMLSLGGGGYQEQNNISLEDWRRQTHYQTNTRIPQNSTNISASIPCSSQLQQQKDQRKRSSTVSSRCTTLDTSSDSDNQSIRQINNGGISQHQRNTTYQENSFQPPMPLSNYQENRYVQPSVLKGPPPISLPHQAIWERMDNKDSVRMRYEPDTYLPVYQIENHSNNSNNNQHLIFNDHAEQQQRYNKNNHAHVNDNKHQHHVSVCVNDLHTTLFIDEDALNSSENSRKSNGEKASIHKFIDRIMKRLSQFKRALDNGLVHIRKRQSSNLENGVIVNEKQLKHNITESNEHHIYQDRQMNKTKTDQITHHVSWSLDNKFVPPYLVIRPQSLLVLPNEIAKFKCCFGGDPMPSLTWYHNDKEISNNDENNSKYRLLQAHDIHYLDIGPLTIKDNGTIKCHIINKLGREETIAQLVVARSASDATPRIIQPLQNISVQEGKPLKLLCAISGPQIEVKWYHNDKLVSPNIVPKSNFNGENAIFTLSKVTQNDSGTCSCIIKNRFGEAKTSCHIDIIQNR